MDLHLNKAMKFQLCMRIVDPGCTCTYLLRQGTRRELFTPVVHNWAYPSYAWNNHYKHFEELGDQARLKPYHW